MRIAMKETCNTLDGPYLAGKEYDVDANRGAEFVRIGWATEVKAEADSKKKSGKSGE